MMTSSTFETGWHVVSLSLAVGGYIGTLVLMRDKIWRMDLSYLLMMV